MQDAQSGHILLSNDFKLQNSVLLGIYEDFKLSMTSFLEIFEEPGNITFDATVLDLSVTDESTLELTTNWEGVKKDGKMFKNFEHEKRAYERYGATLQLLKQDVNSNDSILVRSALYDVFCTEKAILAQNNCAEMLYNFNCPVLLVSEKVEYIEHLFFVFDGTAGSILALKKFIKLFSKRISDAKLTALLINDESQEYVTNEKIVVDFCLANFIDVGIILSTPENVASDLKRVTNPQKNYFVISGLAGIKSIISKNVCNLSSNSIPIFFSTD